MSQMNQSTNIETLPISGLSLISGISRNFCDIVPLCKSQNLKCQPDKTQNLKRQLDNTHTLSPNIILNKYRFQGEIRVFYLNPSENSEQPRQKRPKITNQLSSENNPENQEHGKLQTNVCKTLIFPSKEPSYTNTNDDEVQYVLKRLLIDMPELIHEN